MAGIPQIVVDFPELMKKVILNDCGYIHTRGQDLSEFLLNIDVQRHFNLKPLLSYREEIDKLYGNLIGE